MALSKAQVNGQAKSAPKVSYQNGIDRCKLTTATHEGHVVCITIWLCVSVWRLGCGVVVDAVGMFAKDLGQRGKCDKVCHP